MACNQHICDLGIFHDFLENIDIQTWNLNSSLSLPQRLDCFQGDDTRLGFWQGRIHTNSHDGKTYDMIEREMERHRSPPSNRVCENDEDKFATESATTEARSLKPAES